METYLQQILELVSAPPGSLAYHIVLAFSIFGALPSALSLSRSSGDERGQRMILGLGLLLILNLVLFAATLLGWQELFFSLELLPPLERGLSLVTLVIIAWLWIFPQRVRLADVAASLLALFLLIMSAAGVVWWAGQGTGSTYLTSTADSIQTLVAIGLAILGMFLLYLRKPEDWGLGLAMLGVLLTGEILHWFFAAFEGEIAGAVRLTEMIAYPLMFALPQRFLNEVGLLSQSQAAPTQPMAIAQVDRRYSSDPKVLQAFLAISSETEPEKLYRAIARSISQLMLADICLLVLSPDSNGQIAVPLGYHLILDRSIDGFTLDGRRTPQLASALARGRSYRQLSSASSPEQFSLARGCGLSSAGHLLFTPVTNQGKTLLGVILLTPYSNRIWSAEDQAYLNDALKSLAAILLRIQQISDLQSELEQTRHAAQEAKAQVERANQEQTAGAERLESMFIELQQTQTRAESLAALVAGQDRTQETLTRLEKENQELRESLYAAQETSPDEVAHLEQELRLALEDVARLRAALASADQRWLEFKATEPRNPNDRQREAITTITQELRQPLSSMVGYVDLLLGESIGLLGALQRKFLERVKSSTERMGALVEDLIQVAAIDQHIMNVPPEEVDLNEIIDEAVSVTLGQFSEKNITLRVELPDRLPEISADREALQQVLVNLLQNAGSASPVEGEVALHARVETKENEPGYVLLQVTDSGGGIPSQELPRIFSRLYREENTAIQGVGEGGIGLSVVKSLVESLGGRIWVDSDLGRGATFSILLPLSNHSSPQVPGDVYLRDLAP